MLKYKYFMTVLDFPLLKALTYLVSVTLLGYEGKTDY